MAKVKSSTEPIKEETQVTEQVQPTTPVIHTVCIELMGQIPVPEKNTVTFFCQYSKEFKGVKTFEEGKEYELAQDAADFFQEKGIGKIK